MVGIDLQEMSKEIIVGGSPVSCYYGHLDILVPGRRGGADYLGLYDSLRSSMKG